jgi:hypothetical protein
MREPTHDLVIQFPESAFLDFDDLVRYENALIETLGDAHEVDGHDMRSGEVNFFVFTDDATAALDAVRNARDGALLSHPEVRAAVRLVESGEDFQVVWPLNERGKRDFTVA